MLDLDWDVCPCQIDLQSPQRTSCSFSHRFRTKKLLLSSLARATRRHHGGGPGGRGPADAMRRDSQGRLRRRVHPVLQPLVSPDHDRVPRLSISCRRHGPDRIACARTTRALRDCRTRNRGPPRTTLIPSCWLQTPARARGGCCAGRRVGCADACAGDGEGAAHGGGGVGAPRYVLARVWGRERETAPGRRAAAFSCLFVLRPPAAHAAYTLRPAWGLTTVSLACLGQAVMPQPANRT
jgi:hypothetical protein